MIALDTNAIVRLLIEDDEKQAKIVRDVITHIENHSDRILILSEVIIETVWVLESVYQCNRKEISNFLNTLIQTQTFTLSDPLAIRAAISQYQQGGDFADLVIVHRAKQLSAEKVFSFDKKLKKKFPEFVVDAI